ncbi:MAG TPA: hypothetical protein VD833_16930 [Vicinamibacterales bacterium]|nr:hypothetical protein [Vicinamibacterales bacterium]
MRPLLVAATLTALAACGGSSPTDPSSPQAQPGLRGQTVSAVDGAPSPNLSVLVGSRRATSDANGFFDLDISPGAHRATVRGSAVVERETTLISSGADRARVSLIPGGFDLAAFDEMFRKSNERLQRWTTRPGLVVLGSVMRYRSTTGSEYEAEAEQLSEEEVSEMIAHLTEGLAILTGNTFTSFASVEVERPAAGTRVDTLRANRIVAGRYNGIVTFARTIGYGQWSETSTGAIVEGALYLDRDFDSNDGRRRLLRIHELGHALGYQHVTARVSIMNPSLGPDVTDFDRHGAVIAFQRPVGNRAPDIDPASTAQTSSIDVGGAIRMPPIFCR